MKHFLNIKDLNKQKILDVLSLASILKKEIKLGVFRRDLAHKTLGLYFQKPSTRTRVSFEVGMYQLGGHVIHLTDIGLGKREPIKDVARVLSRYLDAIMIRSFSHGDIDSFARYCTIPVINGLTDLSHPCQALADALTIMDHFGSLEGLRIVYVGDGNNVCRSLVDIGNLLGASVLICCPQGYELQGHHNTLHEHDPYKALKGADVIYTDVWASMGQESEKQQRLKDFENYHIDEEQLSLAHKNAIFLHCLPAHRGEEVSDNVIESKQSLVFDQAENRLHAQKALLLQLLSNAP